MKLTCKDYRDAGYCVKGQKTVIETTTIDFKDFVRNGIDSDFALTFPQFEAATKDVLKRKAADGQEG